MRADVERLYPAFDVYVLASHREGFPRSAMEAAAMGLPIVATDIRGCRQVIDHDVTGLLVPVRDAAGLAHAIGALVTDPQRSARMAAASRDKAVAEFDDRRQVAITLDVYERLRGVAPPPRWPTPHRVKAGPMADTDTGCTRLSPSGVRPRATDRGCPQGREADPRAAVRSGEAVPMDAELTVDRYLDRWLTVPRTRVQPTTWRSYDDMARIYLRPHLGALPLTDLSVSGLNLLFVELLGSGGRRGGPLSRRTVKYAHAVLHKALADAVREGVLTDNVASHVTVPRIEPNRDRWIPSGRPGTRSRCNASWP
jgi:hypothetical protein